MSGRAEAAPDESLERTQLSGRGKVVPDESLEQIRLGEASSSGGSEVDWEASSRVYY